MLLVTPCVGARAATSAARTRCDDTSLRPVIGYTTTQKRRRPKDSAGVRPAGPCICCVPDITKQRRSGNGQADGDFGERYEGCATRSCHDRKPTSTDRKSVVEGQRVSVSVDMGVR